MKAGGLFVVGVGRGGRGTGRPTAPMHVLGPRPHSQASETMCDTVRAHTKEKFVFIAHAAMERVAPLFGADEERVWAANWEPSFIHPLPAKDAQGMVFTVAHGHRASIWVNTEFDL